MHSVAAGCIFDGTNRWSPITLCSGRWLNTKDSVDTDRSDGTKIELWRNGNETHSVKRPLYNSCVHALALTKGSNVPVWIETCLRITDMEQSRKLSRYKKLIMSSSCREMRVIYLKNERPTWCHLPFYFTSYVLNIFRTLTVWRLTTHIWAVPHREPPNVSFYIFIQQI